MNVLINLLAGNRPAPDPGAGKLVYAPPRESAESFGDVMDRVNARVQDAAADARQGTMDAGNEPAPSRPVIERSPAQAPSQAPEQEPPSFDDATPEQALSTQIGTSANARGETRHELPAVIKDAILEALREILPEDAIASTSNIITTAGLEKLIALVQDLLTMEPEKAAQLLVQVSGGSVSKEAALQFLKTLESWMVRTDAALQASTKNPFVADVALPENREAIQTPVSPSSRPADPARPLADIMDWTSLLPMATESEAPTTGEKVLLTLPSQVDETASMDARQVRTLKEFVALLASADAGRVVLQVASEAAAVPTTPIDPKTPEMVVLSQLELKESPEKSPMMVEAMILAKEPVREALTRPIGDILPEVQKAEKTVEQLVGSDLYRQLAAQNRKAAPEATLPVDVPVVTEPVVVVKLPTNPVEKPVVLDPAPRLVETAPAKPVEGVPVPTKPTDAIPVQMKPVEIPLEGVRTPGKPLVQVSSMPVTNVQVEEPSADLPTSIDPDAVLPLETPRDPKTVRPLASSPTVLIEPVVVENGANPSTQDVMPVKRMESATTVPVTDSLTEESAIPNSTLIDPKVTRHLERPVALPVQIAENAGDPSAVKPNEAGAVQSVSKDLSKNSANLESSDQPEPGIPTWTRNDMSWVASSVTTTPKVNTQTFATTLPAINPADLVQQIANQVHAQIARNHTVSKLSFQLVPENLGRVTVQIAVVDQTVTARILVANPEVKEALQHHMIELKTSLNQAGLQIDQLQVHIQGGSSQGLAMYYQYQQEEFASDLRGLASNNIDPETEPIPEQSVQAWGRMNLVNVLV